MPEQTSIPELKGHRGVATVARMPDKTQVIIMCATLEDLERAYTLMAGTGCTPFNPEYTAPSIIISRKALEPS